MRSCDEDAESGFKGKFVTTVVSGLGIGREETLALHLFLQEIWDRGLLKIAKNFPGCKVCRIEWAEPISLSLSVSLCLSLNLSLNLSLFFSLCLSLCLSLSGTHNKAQQQVVGFWASKAPTIRANKNIDTSSLTVWVPCGVGPRSIPLLAVFQHGKRNRKHGGAIQSVHRQQNNALNRASFLCTPVKKNCASVPDHKGSLALLLKHK